MTSIPLGVLAALAAAALFASGLMLQAGEARAQPVGGHLGLVRSLARRPRWLAGTALTLAGWPLQALALLLAPLTLVQPTLVAGLLVVLVLADRRRGGRPGLGSAAAIVAVVAGLAALASVSPAREAARAPDAAGALVLVALGGAALGPWALRSVRRPSAPTLALAAGAAFGWTALATKLAVDALAAGARRSSRWPGWGRSSSPRRWPSGMRWARSRPARRPRWRRSCWWSRSSSRSCSPPCSPERVGLTAPAMP